GPGRGRRRSGVIALDSSGGRSGPSVPPPRRLSGGSSASLPGPASPAPLAPAPRRLPAAAPVPALVQEPFEVGFGEGGEVPPVGRGSVELAVLAPEHQALPAVAHGGRVLLHTGREQDLPRLAVPGIRPASHEGGRGHGRLLARGCR